MRSLFLVVLLLTLNAVRSAQAGQPSPVELASKIDKHLAIAWEGDLLKPATQSDDATFLRRVYLDLIGRIPTVAETRNFLDDTTPDKRLKLVVRLVDSAAHSRHLATFWRREWIPQTETPQFANLADDIDCWLSTKLRDGAAYDVIVRELLTATRTKSGLGTPTTFLTASQFKPENLAANTTRAFLGINLDCAQCHDHPFARWTRDQFWETAAFFTRPVPSNGTVPPSLQVAIPNTKRTVGPQLLIDPQPAWPEVLKDDTGRTILANWVTAKNNPYFARNAVNRVWANLFGTGLVEPLDDQSGENPPSHPELLDELAKAFVESGFDLKYLTTAIVLTKSYQLASTSSDPAKPNPRVFARSMVRGLTGEQLYDSLRVAAGLPAEREDLDPVNALRERKRFAERFRIERSGTAQRSILQSLSLMNGKLTAELTSIENTPTLRAVANSPFLDSKGKVKSLYLATLGRNPTDEELALLAKHLEKGGAAGEQQALADLFWALINSSEFNTNH